MVCLILTRDVIRIYHKSCWRQLSYCGLHLRAVSELGKKSDAVCGFLAHFFAVLRFSDPPYAPLLEVIFLFVRILAKRLNREITRLARRFTLPASRVYTARSGRVFDRNSAWNWRKRTISWPDKGFDPCYSGSVICQNLEMGCGKETVFGIEMTEVLNAMQIIVKKVAWNAESSSPSRPSLQRPASPIPAMWKVSPISFVSQSNQFLEL